MNLWEKEHIKCSLINERKVIIYGLFKEKKYRILMERIDKGIKNATKVGIFLLRNRKKKQNFIIKTKGKCTCRNCNTEFETNKKLMNMISVLNAIILI